MGPDCETGNRLLYAGIIIIRLITEKVTRKLVKRSSSPEEKPSGRIDCTAEEKIHGWI
jgi:hypothetical protein